MTVELTAVTSNEYLVPLAGGSFGAVSEVILIVSEPNYTVDMGGGIIKRREIDVIRFSVTKNSLTTLIESLVDILRSLPELEACANKSSPEPTKREDAGEL